MIYQFGTAGGPDPHPRPNDRILWVAFSRPEIGLPGAGGPLVHPDARLDIDYRAYLYSTSTARGKHPLLLD